MEYKAGDRKKFPKILFTNKYQIERPIISLAALHVVAMLFKYWQGWSATNSIAVANAEYEVCGKSTSREELDFPQNVFEKQSVGQNLSIVE